MNQFNAVRSADTSVRSQIIDWNDKVREYLRELFDSDIERVQGTEFGDAISKIAYLTEKLLTEPDTFRGVIDVQGRVQAGASVEKEIDHLFFDALANAPWNVIKNQHETLKGAATSLMEELVNESKSLGFSGRLKLYSIPRAKQKKVLALLSITGMSEIQGETSHRHRLGVINSATKIAWSKSGTWRQLNRE